MKNEHEKLTVAELLTERLRLCRMSESELAQEMGYPDAKLISMIASGKAKLPVKDIMKLATVLDIDFVYLLLVAMADYMPEMLQVFGEFENVVTSRFLSQEERKLIGAYRRVTDGKDAQMVVCDAGREIVAVVMV